MKIERRTFPTVTFDRFCERHDLTVEIDERPRWICLPRYIASIKNGETMRDGCLLGTYGNGDTEVSAVKDLERKLRGERLAVGAMTPERRNIQCPNEWEEP
jgi:hypothetical protein